MKSYNEITNKIMYNEFEEYLKKYININFTDKFSVWIDNSDLVKRSNYVYFKTKEIFIGTDVDNNYYFLCVNKYATSHVIKIYNNCSMIENNNFIAEKSQFIKNGVDLNSFSHDNYFHLIYKEDLKIKLMREIMRKVCI